MAQLIINILFKYVKMEKIDFYLMGTLRWTDDECTFLSIKVSTGENGDVNYLVTSQAVMLPLLKFIAGHPEHEYRYKENEDDVLELYYTSSSGVLLPLEIGDKIVSFELLWK